ncbi:MAG TPA: hypothetical protein VHZ24_09405 [Pirellulales bacterium]|jgi:hypothetical protein|nr:hypothetical protein [Pirellulales bacterium]
MSTIAEQRPSITPPVKKAVETGADVKSPLTAGSERARWQELIDTMLITWLRNPDLLADDGAEAPDPRIIRLSIDFAERYRDEDRPAPDRIVSDPNGGIIFRRRDGAMSEIVHIWDDGAVEYQRLEGNTIVKREPLTF